MVLIADEMTGEDIRRIRESIFDEEGRPLTHQKFAGLIGVSVAAVSRWENGHFKPSPLARDKVRENFERFRGKRITLEAVDAAAPVVRVVGEGESAHAETPA